MLDDELLTKALRESRDRMLDAFPMESGLDHRFSAEFEQKMEQLCTQTKRKKTPRMPAFARRAAVILLVGFVGASACFMSVDAWREKLFHMVEQKYPAYSNIVYEPSETGVDKGRMRSRPEFSLIEYRPTFLPEGYQLTEQMLDEHINWSRYSRAGEGTISFDQSILGEPSVTINTEGGKLEEFELNGDTAYKMDNRGAQYVLWNDEQYQFMVVTTGGTLEEAVKIAGSVQICPADAPHPPKLAVKDWEIPADYAAEQAVKNGDVVIIEGVITNGGILEGFFEEIAAGNQTIIRVTDFDKGNPRITELYFDGFRGNSTVDNTRTPGQPENHTEGYTYDRFEWVREGTETVLFGVDVTNGKREELARGTIA